MFKITIEGDTIEALAANVLRIAGQFQTTAVGEDDAPAPKSGRGRKTAATTAAPASTTTEDSSSADASALDAEDAALEAELRAKVPPAPETSKQIVDAGTGQPVPQGEPVVQMTFNDVKAAAAKLAAKDTPKLGEILGKYDAAKLSEVPKDKLGDFAADVMEELG